MAFTLLRSFCQQVSNVTVRKIQMNRVLKRRNSDGQEIFLKVFSIVSHRERIKLVWVSIFLLRQNGCPQANKGQQIPARMWGKEQLYLLLVRALTCATTMEIIMRGSPMAKKRTSMWPSYVVPACIPTGHHILTQRYLHIRIDCYASHKSKEMG